MAAKETGSSKLLQTRSTTESPTGTTPPPHHNPTNLFPNRTPTAPQSLIFRNGGRQPRGTPDTTGTRPGQQWVEHRHTTRTTTGWNTTGTLPAYLRARGYDRDTTRTLLEQHWDTTETHNSTRHHCDWDTNHRDTTETPLDILQHHRDTTGKRPGYHWNTTRTGHDRPALRHRDTTETGHHWDRTITPLRHHWDTTYTTKTQRGTTGTPLHHRDTTGTPRGKKSKHEHQPCKK